MFNRNRSDNAQGIASALVALVPLVALSCDAEPAPSAPRSVSQAATAPSLGSAETFSVLAGSTVTNTGDTTVAGDLGVSPGLAVTGFPPGLVSGTVHAGDAVALQAQVDVATAYDALAAQPCTMDLTDQDLGGLTLTQGVYCFSSSSQLTGALVLDAEGDAGAVFIFKIVSTLTTASDASVTVINGGDECSAFWQIGSSATLGTNTEFTGNLLAQASITLNTGATVAGRALARTGAVTLDTNQIQAATCSTTTTTSAASGAGGGASTTGAGAAGGETTTGTSTTAGTGGSAATTGSGGAGGAATTSAAAGTGGGSTSGSGGAGGSDGKTICEDVCVDLETDVEHCGACGYACAPLETCVGGSCVPCPP